MNLPSMSSKTALITGVCMVTGLCLFEAYGLRWSSLPLLSSLPASQCTWHNWTLPVAGLHVGTHDFLLDR